MAENPLLPHAKLRELYATMQRCRTLEDRAARQSGSKVHAAGLAREGLLVATIMQLEAGDVLCPQPGDRTPRLLRHPAAELIHGTADSLTGTLRLPLCAGVARGLQAAAGKRIALCMVRAGSVLSAWPDTLAWAQEQRLPLILTCTDKSGAGRKPQGEILSWDSIARVAQRTGFPVFPVDAEDAVAVYRVMYEAVLRARDGGGPAVLWGVFAKTSKASGEASAKPVARLRAYLRARGITPQL